MNQPQTGHYKNGKTTVLKWILILSKEGLIDLQK